MTFSYTPERPTLQNLDARIEAGSRTVFVGLNQVLYNGASALGRPGLPAYGEGISMAITGIGLYLLLPCYGYVGAAIISSIAYAVSFLVMLVLVGRRFGLSLRFLLVGGRRCR